MHRTTQMNPQLSTREIRNTFYTYFLVYNQRKALWHNLNIDHSIHNLREFRLSRSFYLMCLYDGEYTRIYSILNYFHTSNIYNVPLNQSEERNEFENIQNLVFIYSFVSLATSENNFLQRANYFDLILFQSESISIYIVNISQTTSTHIYLVCLSTWLCVYYFPKTRGIM